MRMGAEEHTQRTVTAPPGLDETTLQRPRNEAEKSMFRILIDTCVWLDLAKDHRDQPIISALETLTNTGQIELIVPQTVVDEFQRNKARVIASARQSLQSHFRLVREAVNRFSVDENKVTLLKSLDEVDHKIVTTDEEVTDSITRIEKLLTAKTPLGITDDVKRCVTDRALNNLAPYHRNKNSVGDAILIETFAWIIGRRSSTETRFAFVTHNSKDFSEPHGDRRRPHPDIARLFTPPKSTYWVSLVEFLREVDPILLANQDAEFNFSMEPRRLSEILEEENVLFKKIWYNRHCNLRSAIEDGEHHVVSDEDYSRNPYRHDQTLDTIWMGALAAAKKTEEELGLENLGPWDDFEWGMLNGKLSALRWLLGDDWDMLDT